MDFVKHLSKQVFGDFGFIHFKPKPLFVTDPALRQSFLERVPINRQIVQEVQKVDS